MAKQKPLPSEINGVKIISDCGNGYLHKNAKTKVRIAIVECIDCKAHRKVNVYPIKAGEGKLCPSCSNKGERNGAYLHGENNMEVRSRANKIWNSIKGRCQNPKNKDFDAYGGRGIKLCDSWQTFEGFKAWVGDKLEDATLSIERKEVDGDYTPSNVMLLPTYLQAYNRRNGMNMKRAKQLAIAVLKHGKPRGYILFYMKMFPELKDYQIKQFVLYSKHKEELSTLEL